MITTKQAIDRSGIAPKLIRSTVRRIGSKDSLTDVANHGADAGYPGFTYYSDTSDFFRRHRADIVELVKSMAEDFGQDPVSMVAGFNCLEDDAETRESAGRCLYGGRLQEDDYIVENALAWFALEEVARAFEA